MARVEALFLLGEADSAIANFSFDGENAGAIVWAERFDNTGIRWKYSLDNKATWSEEIYFTAEQPHIHKLTAEELEKVTEDNDIYILIVGLADDESNYYKIDISSKPAVPNTLYANDYENKIFGLDSRFEWRYLNGTSWTAYSQAEPDCSGNKTVEVRIKASGDNPPSDVRSFDFTDDIDSEKRKYVSVSHMSIESFSSQSTDSKRPNYAVNAIDGNVNTFWHTDYGENVVTSGNMPYLVIKLDAPKYLSGLDFIQYQYSSKINIFAKNVKISVSEDGQNWTTASVLENLEAIGEPKVVTFEDSIYGQYVKIEMTETYGIFATLSMVNLYEDATKNKTPDTPDNPDVPDTPNIPDNPDNPGNSGKPDDGSNTDNPNGGNSKPADNNVIKIVIPVVIGVVAVAAAVAVVIVLKRKKKK